MSLFVDNLVLLLPIIPLWMKHFNMNSQRLKLPKPYDGFLLHTDVKQSFPRFLTMTISNGFTLRYSLLLLTLQLCFLPVIVSGARSSDIDSEPTDIAEHHFDVSSSEIPTTSIGLNRELRWAYFTVTTDLPPTTIESCQCPTGSSRTLQEIEMDPILQQGLHRELTDTGSKSEPVWEKASKCMDEPRSEYDRRAVLGNHYCVIMPKQGRQSSLQCYRPTVKGKRGELPGCVAFLCQKQE